MLDFLPEKVKQETELLGDLPNYINRRQIAKACNITEGVASNWSNILPPYDKKIAGKYYWRPATIAPFIKNYREKNKLSITAD